VTIKAGAIDAAGVAVGLAFLAALGLQYRLSTDAPEKDWYDGRAAAESIKGLAWRYAVRAEPFLTDDDADTLFLARCRETLSEVKTLALVTGGSEQITPWMRRVRQASLGDRQATYLTRRLDDQWQWYKTKATLCRTMATRWRWAVSVLAVVGAIAGFAKALGVTEVDVLGLLATAVGATAAWLQTRQYETLAVAYGLTAQELAASRSAARQATDETAWSDFVNDTEQAVSREHTLWRASRRAHRA
jgi:hypothetical protein